MLLSQGKVWIILLSYVEARFYIRGRVRAMGAIGTCFSPTGGWGHASVSGGVCEPVSIPGKEWKPLLSQGKAGNLFLF